MIEHHCSILDLLFCWPYSCFCYGTSFKMLKLEVEIAFLVSLLVSSLFLSSLLILYFPGFVNYNFSCTRFCACKTLLGGAHPCTWEIVHVKEQMCKLLIITWLRGRNCTKLVFEPLAALFQSCVLFQFTWWLASFLQLLHYLHDLFYKAAPPFLTNWNENSLANLIYWSWTMNTF